MKYIEMTMWERQSEAGPSGKRAIRRKIMLDKTEFVDENEVIVVDLWKTLILQIDAKVDELRSKATKRDMW